MGITKTFKKLMGHNEIKENAVVENVQNVSSGDIQSATETTAEQDSRSVGTISDIVDNRVISEGNSDSNNNNISNNDSNNNNSSNNNYSNSDNKEIKQNRLVGSTWEHKHDDLDWHSMSRPHPLPMTAQTQKNAVSEPNIPARTIQADTSSGQVQDEEKRMKKQDILCKFVVQHDTRIGETISVDSGRLVFKSGAEKLSIPMSSITSITDDNVVVGDFTRDEALKLGEEWYRRTTNALKFDDKGMLIND